ncbi:uncharacterized protein LOC134221876 [Armigeres subalbatus]|uniref:uncharacterized protein LOC134221876 n=1 Tax=Armigeres subalbatus TaxID=124917 RepID=UPI002ED07F7A
MWSAVIACGVGAIALLAVYYRWSRRKVIAAMAKMNGPPKMPLIGHLYLVKFTSQAKIFKFMVHVGNTYQSPVGIRLGHINVVAVHHPEHLQTIMTSQHCISRPLWYGFFRVSRGIFSSPAHLWRGQRKVLSHSFGPGILSSFVPIFNEKSATLTRLMGVHVGKGEHDFHRDMAKAALDTIYSTAFGLNFDMQVAPEGDKYLSYQEQFLHLVVKRMFSVWCYIERIYRLTKDFKREQKVLAYAKTLTDRVLIARKAEDILSRKIEVPTTADDIDGKKPKMFLDKVLELARDNKLQLAKEDITQHMNTIVFAGNDTTANTMSNLLLMLAMHPDVQERVYQEVMEACPGTDQYVSLDDITKLTYTEMVCKETMRLFPVGPVIGRVAEKDIKLSDEYEIPEGSFLMCGIYVAHRDPKIWGPKASEFNPDHFLPENFSKIHPYAYLPFSGGIRNCIAMKYAWVSMKIMIVHILRKYRLTTTLTMDRITLEFFATLKIANGCCISIENRKFSSKKWFGVSASGSSDSSGMYVRGLEFTICSASTTNVCSPSSSSFPSLYASPIAFFTDCTRRSHAPPMWGAPGGMKFHFVVVLVKVAKSPWLIWMLLTLLTLFVCLLILLLVIVNFVHTVQTKYEFAEKLPTVTRAGESVVKLLWRLLWASDVYKFSRVVESFSLPHRLWKLWLGPVVFIGVSHPDLVQIVLTHPDCLQKPFFYQFIRIKKGLLFAEAELWKRHRKALNSSFNLKILHSFIPIFEKCCHRMVSDLNRFSDGETFDVMPFTARCTLEMVFETSLGSGCLPPTESDCLIRHIKRFFNIASSRFLNIHLHYEPIFQLTQRSKKETESLKYCNNVVRQLLSEKRQKSSESSEKLNDTDGKPRIFVDQLLKLDSSFSETDIIHNIFTMIIAGNDTSGQLMAYACLFLGMYPHVQEKVYAEINEIVPQHHTDPISPEELKTLTYTEMFLNECLRLCPTAPTIVRQNMAPIVLDQTNIPAGNVLGISLFAHHRREDIWGPDANQFDPERFSAERSIGRHPYAFLPFSGGSRNCIGWRYAMISMKLMLVYLLREYKIRTKVRFEDLRFRFNAALVLSGKHFVTIEKRKYG